MYFYAQRGNEVKRMTHCEIKYQTRSIGQELSNVLGGR